MDKTVDARSCMRIDGTNMTSIEDKTSIAVIDVTMNTEDDVLLK